MTIQLWCLLAAVLLPYAWLPVAARVRLGLGYDNRHPREQQAKLTGAAARAVAAHKNAFEALAVFAPGVFVAHVAGADAVWSARLCVIWVVCRVLHGVFYVTDQATLRSTVWTVALLAALGLFGLAAFR